jgi:Flp pilus assembly protein TadD
MEMRIVETGKPMIPVDRIATIIELIKEGEYREAKMKISEWMMVEDWRPEIHNLLGAMYEQQGNPVKAMNHYRASYALDPSYVYARLNLERITESFVERKNMQPYYGDEVVD